MLLLMILDPFLVSVGRIVIHDDDIALSQRYGGDDRAIRFVYSPK